MQAILRLLHLVNRLFTETTSAFCRIFPSLKNGELLTLPLPADPNEFVNENYNNISTGDAGATSIPKPFFMSKRLLFFGTFLSVLFLTTFSFVAKAQTTPYEDAGLANPTVTSDKEDYQPGEVAHIIGSGWTLDQEVHVELKEKPDYPDLHIYDLTVAEDGTWSIDFPIEQRHWGVEFTVVATGKSTAYVAQTIFTDATCPNFTGTFTASQAVCVGGTATYTVSPAITGSFGYVWKKGSTILSSGPTGNGSTYAITTTATSSTLTITNVQLADATTSTTRFNVDVTNTCNAVDNPRTVNFNNATLTVTAPPSATISYSAAAYCTTAAKQNVTRTGTSGGTYSSTNGLDINGSTGQIDPGNSQAGSYLVTYTMPAAGGCAGNTASTSVQITAVQTSNPGSNQTICTGATATLNANDPTAPATGIWSIVAGSQSTALTQFSDVNNRNAIFTPAGGVGTYTLRWTITNAPCAPSSNDVTIIVAAQPVSGTLAKNPNVASVCTGINVKAKFSGGTGGGGTVTNVLEYRFDGSGSWNTYGDNDNISTTGHTQVEIRTYRTATGSGCTQSTPNVVSWTVVPQPVNPTINVKSPNVLSVCAGQSLSATFNAGSGGLGCGDDFEYSTNGGTSWTAYIPGTTTISTTGLAGQTVMIHGRHDNCTANTGCTATYDLLASWTVVAQPVNPTLNVKSPNVATVCAGQSLSATFNAGTGGLGCSDDFEYSTDGGTSWTAYIPGTTTISTTGLEGQTVIIHGRHNNCTANTGCTATYVALASWDVVAQPVNPTLNVKSPNVAIVCAGQTLSATFNPGTGGLGCSDDFQYSTDGGNTWATYMPGTTTINTTSLAGQTVQIQGRHNNCTANTGCTATYVLLASWDVVAQPVNPTLNVKSPDVSSVCAGQSLSATFNAGTGGLGCTDDFQYSTNGGSTWLTYMPGTTTINTTSLAGQTVQIQGRHNNCSANTGCTATYDLLASWDVVAQPVNPTLKVKSPDVTTVCAGQSLSATFNDGSGGSGCSDDFQYSTNGGTTWTAYLPGTTTINTTSLAGQTVKIQGRHNNCTANTGCTAAYDLLASWTVVAQPVAPGIVKSPADASVCPGTTLTVTVTAGTGGTGTSQDEYRYDNGSGLFTDWSTTVPSFAAVYGAPNIIESRRTSTGTGCNVSPSNQVSWTVKAPTVITSETINTVSTNTISIVYGCSTPVLRVTGTGQGTVTYKWFRTTNPTSTGGTQVGTGSSYTIPGATPVGTYKYYAEVNATCGTVASNLFTVVITPQEASAENDGSLYYTGPVNSWTPNTSSNTATVTLSAFVKNAGTDNCGDIATARITFQVKNSAGTWTNIPSAQNLPVYYVDPNNPSKGGTAAAIVQLNITNNTATQMFDLKVVVSGNYKAAEKCGYSQITISKLVPGGSISGGTLLCGSTSQGLLRPSTIIPSILGFGVEYVVKQGKAQSPKGKVNLYVSSYSDLNGVNTFPTLNWYKISTNAIASLTVTPKVVVGSTTTPAKASFTSKANVAKYNFYTGETIPIEGNCTVVLDIEDVNTLGVINFQDRLAITVYRNAGGIWFSNNWQTSQTVIRNICGGDVTASGTTTPTSSPSVVDESTRMDIVTPGTFKVRAFPNPTTHLFTIDVQSSSNEPIEVKVFDMIGHMVYYRKGLLKEEHHRFGQMLTDGMYMLHVTQGDKQQTITVIKK